MYKLMKKIPDLIYPRRCPVCDGILTGKEPYVCKKCLPELVFITGAVCFSCGKPLEEEQEEFCFDCRKKQHVFERCRAPFVYRGKIKESLMRYKYLGRAEYAGFYGKAMAEYGKRQHVFETVDLLLPVPVHRSRKIERGYNQAELLAASISRLTGIPYDGNTILRNRKTAAQKTVGGTMRGRNLEGAFSIKESRKKLLKGKRVLLVDDIFTTGSTADAVSRLLLDAGAGSVQVLCLSISPGFS